MYIEHNGKLLKPKLINPRDGNTYHKWTPPSTLDAFSVELMQPLQKLWEKVMHKDKHTDSYITAARLHGGRLFF